MPKEQQMNLKRRKKGEPGYLSMASGDSVCRATIPDAEGDCWCCTRDPDHDGNHAAHILTDDIQVASWPAEKRTAGIGGVGQESTPPRAGPDLLGEVPV